MMASLDVKYDISVTNVIGFLVIFASVVASWVNLQGRTSAIEEWRDSHTITHTRLDERIGVNTDRIGKIAAEQVQEVYRIAQIEKNHEVLDMRINRTAESYASQLSDIRSQLNQISIQIALINDAIKRVEPSRPPLR